MMQLKADECNGGSNKVQSKMADSRSFSEVSLVHLKQKLWVTDDGEDAKVLNLRSKRFLHKYRNEWIWKFPDPLF